jgi:uncharacterized damage-inducible protein DinB
MSEEAQSLAQKLEQEGEKTLAFFRSLEDASWSRPVYTEPHTWTVRDVLAHLVTAEKGLLELFESILRGSPGVAADFSIDDYNARHLEKTAALTPEELLEGYRQVRAETVQWTRQRTSTELERRGRHPFLGETTLREMLKMIYLHNQLHLRDVRKALGT